MKGNGGILLVFSSENRAKHGFLFSTSDQIGPFLFQGTVGPGGSLSTMSDNIWSTLRMTLSLMGRSDLHRAVDTRDLDHLNALFPSDSHDDGVLTG